MSSRISKSQATQQQGGFLNAPSATRTTASTSKMRMGQASGATSTLPGSQGGRSRTEPPRPRPAYPVPSTISPSESASNVPPAPTLRSEGRFGGSRTSSVRPPPVPTHQYPRSAAQYAPAGSFVGGSEPVHMTPMGSNMQPPPASYMSSQQRSARSGVGPSTTRQPPPAQSATSQHRGVRSNPALSTARTSDNLMSGAPRDTRSSVTPSMTRGGTTRAPSQNYAGGLTGGPQPAGISIGASPYGPVNLHYNQVDNRQLTVNNNAPGKVITNTNNVSNVDNSSHHNTNAPQANTHHNNLANVGNTHINVKQRSTSSKKSASQ